MAGTAKREGLAMNAVATKRIERIKSNLRLSARPLCTEKLQLMTDSLRSTEGQPQPIRRALALAAALNAITIWIDDDELLVGHAASRPGGFELACDYGLFTPDEIESLKEDGYSISPEDEVRLVELNRYHEGKTFVNRMGDILFDNPRLWPFMQSGVVLPPWKSREHGSGGGYAQGGMGLGPGLLLGAIDYSLVLDRGLASVIAEAEHELSEIRFDSPDTVERSVYLRAIVISLNAVIRFTHRYADLARSNAATASDPSRRAELETIADICSRVPAEPASSFREALQSFWFTYLVITPSSVAPMGRLDQLLFPFYQSDIDNGVINDDGVVELFACLRLHDMAIDRVAGKTNRKKHSGQAKWHNCTIGGVKSDGTDATNALSYLILEAARVCPTPHHTITIRVNESTPEKLIEKGLEVVRTGLGLPAFVSDRSYIEFLTRSGLPAEQAREYLLAGCLDAAVPGRSRVVSFPFVVVPFIFEVVLNNGRHPRTNAPLGLRTGDLEDFHDFDSLMSAVKAQLRHFLALTAERNHAEVAVQRGAYSDPVLSSLMEGGVTSGRDYLDRKMAFENGSVMCPIGMINLADSLAAIRKIVYDQRRLSLRELKTVLDADWNGYPELHQEFIAAPKFGNDDDYVDSIAADLYRFWAETVSSFQSPFGSPHVPTAISITSHWAGGELTGATPDGRRAGQCLADGSMSPMQGRDHRGPTAVIRSALKIDQDAYQATLLNMKFHQSALATSGDLHKLASLIRTYLEFGGKHVQFNVVDRETLLDAQIHPNEHNDLVVRIAGYSAYFVTLSRTVQNDIIARTEYAGVG